MVKSQNINWKLGNKINFLYSKLNYLNLDVRSLSLFRILLGISLIYNIIFIKWDFIYFLLGEMAFIPLEELQSYTGVKDYSIFDLINTTSFVKTFMILYLINILLFTIGFKTKITSILSVFFQFNIFQALNPLTLGPDMFNFHLSFWAMFLPLNNYFSVDKFFNKSKILSAPSLSISIVLLFQIGCIYFFTGIFKFSDAWVSGYAVRNMLLDDNFSRWMYKFIREREYIYSSLSYLTLLFELLVFPLIFLKWKFVFFRMVVVSLIFLFHGFIFFSYDVGNFSIAGFAVGFLLIPSGFWNIVIKKSSINSSFEYPRLKNMRLKVAVIIFSLFSIYIMLERNVFNYYDYLRDVKVSSIMKKVQIPSPAIASFFTQYWRMFAPGPQDHIGWIELAHSELVEGSTEVFRLRVLYNSFEDKPKLSGWEDFILAIAKNRLYIKSESNYFVKFFSKWVLWKIAMLESESDSIVLDDYNIIEHRKLCGNQSIPHKPKVEKYLYRVSDIAEGKINVIE